MTYVAEPDRYDAVLSDETMPSMNGSELALEIRKLRPAVPIVLMSGYVSPVLVAMLREIGAPDTAAAAPAAADQNALAAALPSNKLASDMIEIERAARALRRAEPLLEPSRPPSESAIEMRGARSIWLLVSVIWLTALLVVSCGVAAVALLLG